MNIRQILKKCNTIFNFDKATLTTNHEPKIFAGQRSILYPLCKAKRHDTQPLTIKECKSEFWSFVMVINPEPGFFKKLHELNPGKKFYINRIEISARILNPDKSTINQLENLKKQIHKRYARAAKHSKNKNTFENQFYSGSTFYIGSKNSQLVMYHDDDADFYHIEFRFAGNKKICSTLQITSSQDLESFDIEKFFYSFFENNIRTIDSIDFLKIGYIISGKKNNPDNEQIGRDYIQSQYILLDDYQGILQHLKNLKQESKEHIIKYTKYRTKQGKFKKAFRMVERSSPIAKRLQKMQVSTFIDKTQV